MSPQPAGVSDLHAEGRAILRVLPHPCFVDAAKEQSGGSFRRSN